MPMSPYVRSLREKIGNDLLEVPSVSILALDQRDHVLLVRHVDSEFWTTPGGMVEPYETPADAAVREMWEETGLYVELTHIIGVFGGELCGGTYSNGDKISWVATLFGSRRLGGELAPDHQETAEARYFSRAEINALKCRPYVAGFLEVAFQQDRTAFFSPPTWKPQGA